MKIDRWIMAVFYSIHTTSYSIFSYLIPYYSSLLQTLLRSTLYVLCTTYRYRVHARPQSSASDRWSDISAARRMQWIGQAIVTRSGEALTCRSVSMNDDIFFVCLSALFAINIYSVQSTLYCIKSAISRVQSRYS